MRREPKEVRRGPSAAEDGGDEKNEVQWNLRERILSDGRKMKCPLCLAM